MISERLARVQPPCNIPEPSLNRSAGPVQWAGKVRRMGQGVLVAGGTGALGGAVVEELAGAGYDVTATWVVERERERAEAAFGGRVKLVQADLFDPDAVA